MTVTQLHTAASNTTATAAPQLIDVGGGRPGVLEQGPAWLASILYTPPWWVIWALTMVLGLVGVATLLGARNIDHGEEWAKVSAQATENLATVAAIAAVTVLSTDVLAFPYLGDIVVGVVGGWLLGLLVGERLGAHVYWALRPAPEVSTDG